MLKTQTAAFDPFGNITTKTTGGVTLNTPTSTATNRLTTAGTTYELVRGEIIDKATGTKRAHIDLWRMKK